MYVSKNRLCIHNLPKSVDSKKLKALCLQAVKGKKGVFINEVRKNNLFFFFLDMLTTRPIGGAVVNSFSLNVRFVLLESGDV